MAKYFMTFILLLCLALENDNIYNRLHARSHPSAREDAVHPSRQHQQYQQLQQAHQHAAQQQTPPQQLHYSNQQRARQPKHMEPDPSEEEDTAANQRREEVRLRRHLRHQRAHQLEQLRSYHRLTDEQPAFDELKSVPRLWQHLSGYHEAKANSVSEEQDYSSEEELRMFADEPAAFSETNIDADPLAFLRSELQQQSLIEELPPAVAEVETVAKHEKQPPPEVQPLASSTGSGCPKCESTRNMPQLSEQELTKLRIEFVKQQILEKLRLKESPNVSAVALPKPIFDGVTLAHAEETAKNKEPDDYYARTSKKFIFLQREERECQRLGNRPSLCFSFKIEDADADGFDVNTAVLWLFKNKQNQTNAANATGIYTRPQQTIVVSEVEQQLSNDYLPLAKTIAIQSVDVQDEWMKIDIEWPIKRWFGNHELSHLIQITCDSCDISRMEEMISVEKDYRPFIMIDTQNRRSKSRQKRSINCSDGVTECCREKLYISFAEIGWHNWILQPPGYDAYFCRGSCSSVASVTQSASTHSSIVKLLSANSTRKPLELVSCCTAKQYSSLQLVVLESNNSATVKTLPNMVVESCGCK